MLTATNPSEICRNGLASQATPAHAPPLAAGSRVVVAMSGGVDSAVVAALLKRDGYDVVGVTLQLYDHGVATGRKGSCCAGQDIHDARRVAEVLAIPHYVLDYEARFRTRVIDAFAAGYAAGETPIPCVTCNSEIKFSELLAFARDLGAVRLATGHYVQRRDSAGGAGLFRGADAARDQSYFLFDTTPAQLDWLAFPLGHMQKAAVRDLASALQLPVANKSDSQDICFVPSGSYAAVIERLRPDAVEPGDIVHVDGRVVGRHKGIINYTVGQRRGLGVAAGEPLHVVRLDAGLRRVIVGPRDSLATRRIVLRDLNWLAELPPERYAGSATQVFARLRSSQPPRPARLFMAGTRAEVLLDEPEYGIASGQAAVIYDTDAAEARLLGGGWIARAVPLSEVADGSVVAKTGSAGTRRANPLMNRS